MTRNKAKLIEQFTKLAILNGFPKSIEHLNKMEFINSLQEKPVYIIKMYIREVTI